MTGKSNSEPFDFAVIGAGINGLAIAHALYRRHPGARLAIFERFHSAAPIQASSHGQLRITRSAYAGAREVKGMICALEEWRILERELGTRLIHFHPMCFFGHPDGAMMAYANAVAEAKARFPNLALRLIDVAEAAGAFPQFRFSPGTVVIEDQTAGIILASVTIRRLLDRLLEGGINVRCRTRIGRIEHASCGYRLQTDNGCLRTRRLVVAAGPWLRDLVPRLATAIIPIRQTVGYFRLEGLHGGTGIGEFPPWAHMGRSSDSFHYGLPAHRGQGLKVARHVTAGPASNLQVVDEEAVSAAAMELIEFVRNHFVASKVDLLEIEHCLYSCRSGENFVVDWLDDSCRAVVVGAGNGHMFKWAPFVGRAVADMLTEGEPSQSEARELLPAWAI
ncbi:MAG: FAD-dependent oxidoreductase [Xanthomonadales bacterium]|nr:FAD-dependent oxidoreductase [Xanthomonadales bacterium]